MVCLFCCLVFDWLLRCLCVVCFRVLFVCVIVVSFVMGVSFMLLCCAPFVLIVDCL